MKNFTKKIFQSKSSISNWLLVFLAITLFISVATIKDLSRTIQKEQYLRICPEPYICVIPPENWNTGRHQVPLGLTYYKRIPV